MFQIYRESVVPFLFDDLFSIVLSEQKKIDKK